MEDVLDVYKGAYDPKRPKICMDEGSIQLVSDKIEALPMEPGKVKREDYEYQREGSCSVFLACEPLTGKIIAEAKERRTKQDFAPFCARFARCTLPGSRAAGAGDGQFEHASVSFLLSYLSGRRSKEDL